MKSKNVLFSALCLIVVFCISCQHEKVFYPVSDESEVDWKNVLWTKEKIPCYFIDGANVIQYNGFRISYNQQDGFMIPVHKNHRTGGAFWLTSNKIAYGQKFYCFAGVSTIPPNVLSLDDLQRYVVSSVPAGQYKVVCSKIKWQGLDAFYLQRVHRDPATAAMVVEKGYYALNSHKTRSMISAGYGYQEYQNFKDNADLSALGEKFLQSVDFQK